LFKISKDTNEDVIMMNGLFGQTKKVFLETFLHIRTTVSYNFIVFVLHLKLSPIKILI